MDLLPGPSSKDRGLEGLDCVLSGETLTGAAVRGMENPMDGGAWRATVRGVAKSQT